jgi:hypothetical protein
MISEYPGVSKLCLGKVSGACLVVMWSWGIPYVVVCVCLCLDEVFCGDSPKSHRNMSGPSC